MFDAAPAPTRRRLLAAGLALALAAPLAGPLAAQEAREVVEMSLGAADAPVTLIEYASLSCPHCARFHASVWPEIKSEYVDSGKLRVVFREIYFDGPGLRAAMVARCAPADRYFGIVDLLFSTQSDWFIPSDGSAMLQKLYSIGKQAGLTDAELDSCLEYCKPEDDPKDCIEKNPLALGLVAEFRKHSSADGIDSTPSFMINGRKYGNMAWPDFQALIEAALGG